MCDDKNTSKFYYAHHVHDAKKRPLSSTVSRASTHSDRLASRLVQLISSNKAATAFREIEENAFHIKYGFYDQFKSLL
jgi:tRNA splicing endonuclease